jgi:carbon monoxide dehydrogenase subunit G
LSADFFSHKIAPEISFWRKSAVIFDGRIDLDAPMEKAWDFLIDINKFSTCLPGIDAVKQIDDRTFDGIISANVGPISGKFNFRSTIVESRAPEQMVVRTEGVDSVTKSTINADMTVDLRKVSETQSQMDYKADVKIKGRLGILGDMVLRATATLILQEFTKRLRTGLREQ